VRHEPIFCLPGIRMAVNKQSGKNTFLRNIRSTVIIATAATRESQEEKLRVGKSTSLLVAQAQRDLVASQIGEIQAITNYFKTLVALYRLEGSLLQRRGVSAPGAEPITLDDGM
jgi:hypothetical protein